ncbi:MAG: hypothetical protein K5882_00085 [Bacteroidales bacterium]|nr:hypothetical protein [Bacteroidales bacterium]
MLHGDYRKNTFRPVRGDSTVEEEGSDVEVCGADKCHERGRMILRREKDNWLRAGVRQGLRKARRRGGFVKVIGYGLLVIDWGYSRRWWVMVCSRAGAPK